MMNRKRMKYVLVLLLICLAVSGILWKKYDRTSEMPDAALSEGTEERIRIGFSLAEGSNRWTEKYYENISSVFQENEWELLYHPCESATREWQYQDVMQLLEEDIDYLLILPRDRSIISYVSEAAHEKGVKVILISSENKIDDRCDVTISIDFRKEGELCAQLLAEEFQHRVGCILILEGPEESSVAQERLNGFVSEIRKYSNMYIIKSVETEFDEVLSKDLMGEIIRSNPRGSINAVFSCSDEDGIGAMQAVRLAGYDEFKFISIDGIQDAIKAVMAGEYLASIESGKNLGETVSDIIKRMRQGDNVSHLFVVPYQIYDQTMEEQDLYLKLF